MFSGLGYTEMFLFGIIALMLFGSRLPDVARNFGRGYRDIRRRIDDIQREFRDWDKPDTSAPSKPLFTPTEDEPSKRSPSAPKFVPPADDN